MIEAEQKPRADRVHASVALVSHDSSPTPTGNCLWRETVPESSHPERQSTDSTFPPSLNAGKIFLLCMRAQDVPELTRISSKGQVVIPSRVREKLGIKAGSVFAILTPRKGNVVVLKKIDSKSLQADLRIFREVEKAWREIERGQARRASRKRFLEELETW